MGLFRFRDRWQNTLRPALAAGVDGDALAQKLEQRDKDLEAYLDIKPSLQSRSLGGTLTLNTAGDPVTIATLTLNLRQSDVVTIISSATLSPAGAGAAGQCLLQFWLGGSPMNNQITGEAQVQGVTNTATMVAHVVYTPPADGTYVITILAYQLVPGAVNYTIHGIGSTGYTLTITR